MAGSSKTIFIDTSAFVGIYNTDDAHAKNAALINKKIQQRNINLLTTNYVVAEALTVISQRAGKPQARSFGDYIFSGRLPILQIDEDLQQQSYDYFKTVKQKDVSYVDCTCFVVCKQLGIKQVFSFDNHFEKHGLKLLTP